MLQSASRAAAEARGSTGEDGAGAAAGAQLPPPIMAMAGPGGPMPAGLAAHLMAIARSGRLSSASSAASGGASAANRPRSTPTSGAAALAAAIQATSSNGPSSVSSAAARAANPFAAAAAAAGLGSSGAAHEAADRMQRLSSAVAGSIFSDLISGALRPGDMGPPPASEKAIDALERDVQCEPGASCPVCLCELAAAAEGTCARMPCGHSFHDSCVTKWLRSHNTCPVCRAQVEADETQRPTSLSAFLQGWRDQQQQNAQHARSEGDGAGGSAGPDALAGGAGSSSAGRPGTAAPAAAPSLSESELLALSVAELKRRLSELHVPFDGVVEKRELQDLLRRASAEHDRARSGPRLHVQLHMEVVQLPAGANSMRALEAAARAAAASHLARATAAAANPGAPAPAPAAVAMSAARAASMAPPTTTITTPATGPAESEEPRRTSRRRGREHTPGEYSESGKAARRS